MDFKGESLEAHEVRFVERFLDAGQQLEWIKRASDHRPTNDFLWTNNNNVPTELKSTRARFETIHGQIVKAASRAAKQSVTKDNFMIDIGDEPLTDELREKLAAYNVGRRKYRAAGIWVMAQGQLHEIDLRK